MSKKKGIVLAFYVKSLIIAAVVICLGVHYCFTAKAADAQKYGYNIGYTELMHAVNRANIDEIKTVLDQMKKKGVSIDTPAGDKYGMSALELVVYNGNDPKTPEIVKLLLDHGASTAFQDNEGNTPMHQVVNVIEDASVGGVEESQKMQVVELLMKHDAPINVQNKIGNTPMHLIVQLQPTFAQKLIEKYGPMINFSIQNNQNDSIIDYAKSGIGSLYDVYLADYLETQKQKFGNTDAQKRDPIFGRTGLMFAIIRNDFDFVKGQTTTTLFQQKADPNAQENKDPTGNRPLHFSIVRGINVQPYIELLLNAPTSEDGSIQPADPRLTNNSGDTPLHLIWQIKDVQERQKVAELLLEKGALLLVKNQKGDTPLHSLAQHGDADTIRYIRNNIGTWVKNNKGLTARDEAQAHNILDAFPY